MAKSLAKPSIYCSKYYSPIGRLYIASTTKGICKISLPSEQKKEFLDWLQSHFPYHAIVFATSKNRSVIEQLDRYFRRKLSRFSLALDLAGTPFQIVTWKTLRKIPYGKIISYKDLAKRSGHERAYQATGNANARNPIPIIIPCHRVIGSDATLVGYAGGLKTKEFLLRLEGAPIH